MQDIIAPFMRIASSSAMLSRLSVKWSQHHRVLHQSVDSLLGIVLWYILHDVDLFSSGLDGLTKMIVSLENLIEWLTRNPVGLKLNSPLNNILAQFFTYHIYLWRSYVSAASVWIGFQFLWICCPFGLTIFLSAVSDLTSVFTIHIFCFYIYASRLFTLFVTSIRSLWRIFRGRKYNPLRSRVDSVRLDSRQLFIATLFFMILLFLLPTVAVYWAVFAFLKHSLALVHSVLRLLCWCEDRLVEHLISVIPLFAQLQLKQNGR